MASNSPKIVKVVQLKRFMPESIYFPKTFHQRLRIPCQPLQTKNLDNKENFKIKDVPIELNEDIKTKNSELKDDGTRIENLAHKDPFANVRFRKCSHTPEDLERLAEHKDDSLLKLGDIFDSRESLKEYLESNAKRWCFYYVCRNSKKRIIEYNCLCTGYLVKKRDVVLRRHKQRNTACPCKFKLAIDEQTKKLIVYYVCHHHDHCLSEAAFHQYPHAKYLPKQVKEDFLDLAYFGVDIDLIQRYVHSLTQLTIKRKDIWSYVYKFKKKRLTREISAERTVYIEDLIQRLQDMYIEIYEKSKAEKSGDKELRAKKDSNKRTKPLKRRKSQLEIKRCTGINSVVMDVDSQQNLTYNVKNKNEQNTMIIDKPTDISGVIIQYINEDGILCDENGKPVTNSSAIIQFINNYENIMPMNDIDIEQTYFHEGPELSEFVENADKEIDSVNWDFLENSNSSLNNNKISVICENPSYNKLSDEFFESIHDDEVPVLCLIEDDEACLIQEGSNVVIDIQPEKRLSPTPATEACYPDIVEFEKSYYSDHRYLKYEETINSENYAHDENITGDSSKQFLSTSQYVIKAPRVVYHPNPIKKYCGHKNMITLEDPNRVLPGDKFLSHEIFVRYINEHAVRWHYYYSMVESAKSPENYVYKCVYAKHRVSKNAYRSQGIRKRASRTTKCPCQIRLRRLDSDPTYLTVLYSCNHHDHPLTEEAFKGLPHGRRLPEYVKEEIKDLLTLGASFEILRKYVAEETGLTMYGKYYHNVKVKMRKTNEQRHFSEERVVCLTDKMKRLEAMCLEEAKASTQKVNLVETKSRKRKASPVEEYNDPVEMMEHVEDDCFIPFIDTESSSVTSERSRLETRLENLSSHEETLLSVQKLQDSVRNENMT